MPTYSYKCLDCGQTWNDFRAMHDRQNSTCVCCMAWGGEKRQGEDGQFHSPIKIEIGHSMPEYRARDIVEREGSLELGEVPMPSLGPNVTIRTDAQRQESMKRIRDAHYANTDGEHRVLRPFQNDRGEVEYDYQTTHTTGQDLGEIVDARELKVGKDAMEAAQEQVERSLEATGGKVPHEKGVHSPEMAAELRAQAARNVPKTRRRSRGKKRVAA